MSASSSKFDFLAVLIYEGHCQSSSRSPGTRLKSLVLCETSVKPVARAIAAIIKLFEPIGVARAARCARMMAYFSAAQSSKGNET